jgi:hypothetical protein
MITKKQAVLNKVADYMGSTFVGAALVFSANIYLQNRQRKNANKAAGNMALTILSKQYGDFVIFRAGLKNELSEREQFPAWLQLQPTIFSLSESLRFDMPTLVFLLEHKQPEILKMLLIAETKYHDLRMLIERNSDACEIRDIDISNATSSPFGPWDFPTVETYVDTRKKTMLSHFNIFLQQRARDDVQIYRAAGKALTEIMNKIARPGEVMPFEALGVINGLENQDWPKKSNADGAA